MVNFFRNNIVSDLKSNQKIYPSRKTNFHNNFGKRPLLRKSERRKATKKNIENQCLFSSSLLQKSECRKE